MLLLLAQRLLPVAHLLLLVALLLPVGDLVLTVAALLPEDFLVAPEAVPALVVQAVLGVALAGPQVLAARAGSAVLAVPVRAL
jgi:hypothetical protein